MSIKVTTERTLIMGDTHFPFQDDKAIETALDFTKHIKPDSIILNGDIIDFYALSKFNKEPKRRLGLQDEIDEAVGFFSKLRKVSKDSEIIYNEGNHEIRLRTHLAEKGTEYYYLRDLQPEKLMRLDDYDIIYNRARSRGAIVDVGLVGVGHFDVARKHSGDTAQALVSSRFQSVVQGHVHRLGAYYIRAGGYLYAGYEGGCLCDLVKPEYLDDCNWHQGLTLIEKAPSGRYFVHLIPTVGGDILYEGRIF